MPRCFAVVAIWASNSATGTPYVTPGTYESRALQVVGRQAPSPLPLQRRESACVPQGDSTTRKLTMAGKVKPLKKDHLRLALRDPRLQPKTKPKTYVWPRPKRKSRFTQEEAGRFFSATLR